MPLTLQFGPWAPDLANTPIQVPDNQGPMQIPCADCMNVYFANGAYQSMPSPTTASINGNPVSNLGIQALAAFAYYDIVEQQATVFVGTQGGVQQLTSAGAWATVPLVTSPTTALTGQSMAFSCGNLGNTNQLHLNRATFSTGKVGTNLTGISITAGIWSGSRSLIGYSNVPGYVFGKIQLGALSFGTIVELYDGSGGSNVVIASSFDPTQSAFNHVTVNGKTMYSASATLYSYSAGYAAWFFPTKFGLVSGSTYPVTIV